MKFVITSKILTIVVGVDTALGAHLQQKFRDKGHIVLGISCLNADGESKDLYKNIFIGANPADFYKRLAHDVSTNQVSNLVFCQEMNQSGAVMQNSVENWKKHNHINVELPLGILEVLQPQMNEFSRVFFLSRSLSFLPLANNGFYSASKIAMSYLIHSLRLEKPIYSISAGNIDDGTTQVRERNIDQGEGAVDNVEFEEVVANDIIKAIFSGTSEFMENDWIFPSDVRKREPVLEA